MITKPIKEKLSQMQQDLEDWYDTEMETLTEEHIAKIEEVGHAPLSQYEQKLGELIEKYKKYSKRLTSLENMRIKFENFLRPKQKRL